MRSVGMLLVLVGFAVSAAVAQSAAGSEAKQALALRVPADAIRVDGLLDEAVWALARPITDFIQKEPEEGAAPTERTEVRLAYDDNALYVAARMYSSGGRSAIQAPMGPRDTRDQAESILISLDTFLDRRTAYTFGVTAAGVRIDHFHRSDSETAIDSGFDPVWAAAVTVDDEGWTAEMWIPYSQLRFTDLPEQIWGLNIHRWIPSKNEDDYWILVPRTEQGWASRFGEVRGIEAITVTRRLEVMPYVTAGSSINGNRDRANPFDDGRNLEGRIGADLKMGLGPNLTLDATVNPDFGQVEADPAVVNLSVNETFFNEQRPFFSEGADLLSGSTPNYFYSRRIGAPPPGGATGDYVKYPQSAAILGAAKVTGRLPSGTSLGILGALTDDAKARVFAVVPGTFDVIRVAPRTAWGVARVQQEVGSNGSTVSLMATGVRRDLERGEPLAGLLARHAFTANTDALLRLAGGAYEVSLSGGVSYIDGDEAAILRAQRASQRYFQRPDVDHVRVDPTRTSLAGWKATVQADKLSGTHWLWNFFLDFESPAVEFNDMGRLGAGDGISNRQSLTWRETQPTRLFRNYRFTLGSMTEWTYGGNRTQASLSGSANQTWHNFWTTSASVDVRARVQDWRLTRGGPSMGSPFDWTSNFSIRNSPSAQTNWNASFRYGRDELGGWNTRLQGSLAMVPSPRWRLSLSPTIESLVDPRQYVTARTGGSEATYGQRYIFAFIDRTTLSLQARLNYTLKPDLDVTLYAQPFAASGRYFDFGELAEARSRLLRPYGTDGTSVEALLEGGYRIRDGADTFVLANRDFNVRSFRSTSVLRWEWRPGSTLYVVWQQNRSEEEVSADPARLGDILSSLTAVGSNYFAVKASYWLGR